jgi:predicted TIM-barrel fold metal-dependent hydrolase
VGETARHIASHTIEMELASLNLIWGGVCERFPSLRFGFLESGGGWMAGWLDRMDRHYDNTFRPGAPKLRPSEYFQRQCWISFEPVEESLRYLAEYIGPDKILWATDYPHDDGYFPGAPKMIQEKLPQHLHHAVLAKGAIGFYNMTI